VIADWMKTLAARALGPAKYLLRLHQQHRLHRLFSLLMRMAQHSSTTDE
jgi:hypothetical protein